jgi:hypothetical protein
MKLNSIVLITLATLGCTVATMAQNLPSYLPANGLVGWWPFNGNANDESGNGNNGIVNGVTLTEDRSGSVGSAFSFNGTSSYISLPQTLGIENQSQFTISMWLPSTNVGGCVFNQWLTGIGGSSQNIGIQISVNPNQISVCQLGGCPGGINYSTPSNLNGWVNIILVFNGNESSNSRWNLIVNGDLVSTSGNVQTPGTIGTSNPRLSLIGASSGFVGGPITSYYTGSLDDIAIWNRALTQQEITALYTASSTNTNEVANTINNVPGAISYQAVARHAQGLPLANANLEVQFSLLADSLTGIAEYTETHTLTTNQFGLFTTAFGAGTSVSGTFSGINWWAGNKYLHVQMNTGSGWVDMGTQQLLATPYSMHSATSGAIKNPGLPVFADNAAAIAGGLSVGEMYRTSDGVLMVVY